MREDEVAKQLTESLKPLNRKLEEMTGDKDFAESVTAVVSIVGANFVLAYHELGKRGEIAFGEMLRQMFSDDFIESLKEVVQ